jgi:predicted nucleic acid-binding protein
VILIDLFNGSEPAAAFVAQVGPAGFVSAITRAEVLAGFELDEMELPRSLLGRFRWLDLDAAVADLAARLRREHRWKLPDAFQAALALHHGHRLATRNTKDFPPERHPFVLVPYT